MARRRLGELLVEIGIIDDFQLRSALSDQKRWGRPLGATLVKLGFVGEEELVRVLSRHLDVPIVDLRGKRIAPDALACLAVEVAEKSRCIPLFKKREGGAEVLYLGMEDPTDLAVVDDLSFRTGLKIRAVLVGPSQLADAIERHYHKLEWEDEEQRAAAAFETPVEPGDTAPLVYQPELPDVRTPKVVGPDMIERDPLPLELAPVRDADGQFEFALASEPPPAARNPEPAPGPPTPHPALRQLGPEFIVDPEARRAAKPAPPAPAPAPSAAAAAPLARPAAPAAAAAPEPTAPDKPREVPTRIILRALTQLLIEKKLIARAELLERIRDLERAADGEDDEGVGRG
jgi:type IV pilus assembly protein PilB